MICLYKTRIYFDSIIIYVIVLSIFSIGLIYISLDTVPFIFIAVFILFVFVFVYLLSIQKYIIVFKLYNDCILITFPLKLFKKEININFKEISYIEINEIVGPSRGQLPKFVIVSKVNKKKSYQFMAPRNDFQILIDSTRQQGVHVKIINQNVWN